MVWYLNPERVEKYKELAFSGKTISGKQHELVQNVTEIYKIYSVTLERTIFWKCFFLQFGSLSLNIKRKHFH